MKIFSQYINEKCDTADINQGNALSNTGVSNHLTPIGNIVTNVKNLFATRLSVVASVAEDGVSIKLNSSYFTDPKEINKILYNYEIMRGTCLATYIMSQGLDLIKTINLGQFYVVYFCPSDIKTAMPAVEPEQANLPCKEMLDYNLDEAEMIILKEDAEEELADITKEKLSEILKMDDKVKAAKQLELLVMQDVDLPREYYFAGVKDKQGNESIALRWKYTRSGGKGQTVEVTKSLINIYDDGENGVWVSDFAEDALVELPEDVKKLIETVLEFIGANEANSKGTYTIGGERKSKDDDKDDDKSDDKDEDTKDSDEKDEDKDKNKSDEKDEDKDKSDEDKDKSDDEDEDDSKKKKDKKKKSDDNLDVDDLL
jgi:hypothetical protein